MYTLHILMSDVAKIANSIHIAKIRLSEPAFVESTS